MSLVRSKSLPGVGGWGVEGEDDSSTCPEERGRDSGVIVGSDLPSFGSEPRSSLLGELPSGAAISEPPFEELDHPKKDKRKNKSYEANSDIKKATIGRHYYPEGGWGWVVLVMALMVQIFAHGMHQSYGVVFIEMTKMYDASYMSASWLGSLSTSFALLASPVTIAMCRRKSTRLTAVLGGLVTALGCLFTSFASQYHQLFFSYGIFMGIGVGMTRDSSTLMVGQYFKRRREFVEIIVVSGSGLGISIMSAFIKGAINSIGWRLGLQAVTGVVFLTFLMGTFYRSASLYHPQRRAILHLKNQKKKIKEKNRQEQKPPFFDIATLRSRTVQILLVSIGLSSFGITTPIIYLAHQASKEGHGDTSVYLLQTYLGLGWVTGCCVFGFLVVQKNTECRVGRQYLCQASMFLCGIATLAFTAVEGYHGYVLFAWVYGMFSGGFHYCLKMYIYEKVRARNFARTWGFVQCSQAIPTAIGVPITGYINIVYDNKAGYYFSSTFIIFGSMTIFLIDIHRRNAARHKHSQRSGSNHTCVKETCPEARGRRDSLAQLDLGPQITPLGLIAHKQLAVLEAGGPEGRNKPELTCISEEGIADMDLPDHLLEELEYLGDCITSCDKVENFLMMSEYENNLGKTTAEISTNQSLDRKNRRRLFSIRQNSSSLNGSNGTGIFKNVLNNRSEALRRGSTELKLALQNSTPPPVNNLQFQSGSSTSNSLISNSKNQNVVNSGNYRTITVIEEASV